jgi:integrase
MIDGAVPYIWFRNHKERIMGKKRLEHIIPLVDPLLGLLADYLSRADLNRNEPIFPTYGGGRHSSADRSKKLSKHIVNMRSGFDNSQLSPYSQQHTFKDRAVVAGVPSSVTEYLMGHRTKQSSAIHERYGTGLPSQELLKWMVAIQEVTEHGHFHGESLD